MRRWILLFLLPLLFLARATPVRASSAIRVYIAGDASAVSPALDLAGRGVFFIVDDPSQADVLLLNGAIPDPGLVAKRLAGGAGLVLILGPDISSDAFGTATGIPVKFQAADTAVSLEVISGINDPISRQIIWNGSPQVRERFRIETPVSSVQPLVTGYEDGGWLIWSNPARKTYVVDFFLGANDNPQFREWAYYNYLIYHLVTRAAGGALQDFAQYPGSPVPHAGDRNILWAILAILILITFGIFFFVRRYSLRHPEALDQISRRPIQAKAGEKKSDAWEKVGFERPLSGFLIGLMLGLILFVPLIIYQNLILPTYILPSAQALGLWGRVTQFFNLAWYFFDMGTSTALIKFLSEYRVHDPKKGIQFCQVFVWWQALSGAVQVALVVGLASSVVPNSAYALYAWSVIVHAAIQLPGFYEVFRHALSGFQRQDAARILDILLYVVMPVLVQPMFVGLMYSWGRTHPAFGASMGGLLGMGIAAYTAYLLTFLVGWGLYRRLGYNAGVLFLAHFDWGVVRKAFGFGVFDMLASAAWTGGQAAEIWITQNRLINYAEVWGNWVLAQNFLFAYQVLQTLTDGVMAAISEAVSHGKRILSTYYAAMSYKWGGLTSAFIGAVLLAVAPSFLLGATEPEFHRSAIYVVPLAVWGAIQYLSWVGDNVQLGANKPYLKTILTFGEQTTRVFFLFVLLAFYQVPALIIAYFIGLLGKGIAAFVVNHKLCFPQKIYLHQSIIAPLLAGAAHWLILHAVTVWIWRGDQVTSMLLLFLAILPSFPVYMFLYGLAGGWDDGTLGELKEAVGMTGRLRPVVWVVWGASAAGARLSPLHNRFPIRIRPAAMEEARSLTLEKVRL